MRVVADAPGSLLLVGEYAVLEPGGRGISLAPNVRAACTVETTGSSAFDVAITTRFGGKVARYPRSDAPGCPAIFAAVEQACGEITGRTHATAPSTWKTTIDTQAFYLGSRKLGFGSSAAAAVCLTAATLAAVRAGLARPARQPGPQGRSATAEPTDEGGASSAEILSAAVRAHRLAQDGRGSGYDVATSVTGGACLFTGGSEAEVESVSLPWLPACYLYRGPHAVDTSAAVGDYERWTSREPAHASRFVEQTNALVNELVQTRSWDDARQLLVRAAALSAKLGGQIGVDATPAVFPRSGTLGNVASVLDRLPERRFFTKSLGAGNETGILMVREPDEELHRTLIAAGLTPLTISREGVRIA